MSRAREFECRIYAVLSPFIIKRASRTVDYLKSDHIIIFKEIGRAL